MRKQTTHVRTGMGKKIGAIAAGAALLVLFAVTGYRLFHPVYVPPAFESSATSGVPVPPENMGYGEISAPGGFSFSVAGTMYQQEDGSLLIYLTNPQDSEVNLMCEITDRAARIIYKSGVLRPGEYVERLRPAEQIPNEATEIAMNVYAFEPDTWYSKGTISLNNILQPY